MSSHSLATHATPGTAKPRRTQAQRLATTRARIIAATISYIDERGLHQASLQQVARQAGVTVGAVQHHFASKPALLTAVVEDSFRQLANNMRGIVFEGKSLEQRISLFVDQCWSFCNSAPFQASMHILLGMRAAQHHTEQFEPWLNQTLGSVILEGFAQWHRAFAEIRLTEQQRLDLLLYLFSSLSGTALLARISQKQERIDNDLGVLKELMLLKFQTAR